MKAAPRCGLGVALALGTAALAGPALATAGLVPWPGGAAPSPADVREALDEASRLADRERADELLEAAERGEDREHFTVPQPEIDAGLWDLARLFRAGDALFNHAFDLGDGLGATGVLAPLAPVHCGARGGRDSFSCAGCHSAGGADGAGNEPERALLDGDGVRTSSALVRDAPALLGLGLVQALGAEMSAELAVLRDAGLAEAARVGLPISVPLETHGVSFGTLVARADGSLDATGVDGVDADLVVRPFGWKGDVALLRRFAEEAARVHFGVQSHVLALAHRDDPDPERLGTGVDWWDPDGDGVTRELDDGALTAVATYLALLETPVIVPPAAPELFARWAAGEARFGAIGCADCHRDTLVLRRTTWVERPDTTTGPGVAIRLLVDGDAPRGSAAVHLYSDLRRHDMGETLADARDSPSGVAASEFLTRPLWGLAESAPYLHDGRAATLSEAILAHDGEARASREAYEALLEEERRDVAIFLLSLTRSPRLRVAR